jgi:hypothetical protein
LKYSRSVGEVIVSEVIVSEVIFGEVTPPDKNISNSG